MKTKEQLTPFSMYIESLKAKNSKRSTSQILNRIAEFLGDGEYDADSFAWHNLDRDDVGAVKDWLQDEFSPSTVNKGLSALRCVLKEAWRLGLMSHDNYLAAADVSDIENHIEKPGRLLEDSEIKKLIATCAGTSNAEIRDHAMLVLLYATGARRSEIINLDIPDFDVRAKSLYFRETKGWSNRLVFINDEVAAILSTWIDLLKTPGAIFRRVLKNDRIVDSRLTDQGLYMILTSKAKQAGVANITPHDFRYTFISKLIDSGVDLVTVANVVGHKNVTLTMSYDRRGIVPAKSALLALPG